MPPSLLDFPPELFESIIRLLSLCDLFSLRLCSRTLATKTTGDHFKSHFRTKHIDITASSLGAFVNATQPGSLGCLIQNLVLVGVVNNTQQLRSILEPEYSSSEEESDEEVERREENQAKAQQDLDILEQRQTEYEQLHESGTDISLLSEAFRNIAANGKTGKLLSLSLEVIVYRQDAEQRVHPLSGGSWKFIWQSAANTFHTTIRALAASSLPIERLNIFNDQRLQRCSLACHELGSTDFTDKGLATSLAALKSLSISLSDRDIFRSRLDAERYDPVEELDEDLTNEQRDIEAEMTAEVNFIGIAKLLQVGSQLEEFEMHEYRFSKALNPNRERQLERLLQHAAEMNTLPRLKRIELRGLWVREQDLLTFVRRTGVRKLFMYNIYMSSGTFRSLFDYCTSDVARLEKLYFRGLFEAADHSMLCFDSPADPTYPPWVLAGAGLISDTLERTGAEVKQPIIYHFDSGRAVSSPTLAEWHIQRWREYGPPNWGFS
jgi:DnaJ-domain-containing protein 1